MKGVLLLRSNEIGYKADRHVASEIAGWIHLFGHGGTSFDSPGFMPPRWLFAEAAMGQIHSATAVEQR